MDKDERWQTVCGILTGYYANIDCWQLYLGILKTIIKIIILNKSCQQSLPDIKLIISAEIMPFASFNTLLVSPIFEFIDQGFELVLLYI